MSTDPNADDRGLFVADFYPQLGEYLAELHASGYDAVAARARFMFWLAANVEGAPVAPRGAGPVTAGPVTAGPFGAGPFGADSELMDYLAEAVKVPEPDREEIAELAARIGVGRRAEDGLAVGGDALTADEAAGLERAAERGRQAQNRLLEGHLRLVVGIAERYAGRSVPFPDLVRAGSLGLSRAVEVFDPGKGYDFPVYAGWWIRQAITRALAANVRGPRIPVHTVEAITEIVQAQRRLAGELGREPTPEELAAEFGTRPEDAGP
jgi:RNA polymerase primary sigma factor